MRLFFFLLCLAALPLSVVLAEEYEVTELERDFASADLRIIHRASDISIDVREKLFSITGQTIADFGEQWNSTDVLYADQPTAQHLFTGESDVVAAVAFQTGGYGGATLRLLVTRRQADWFCLYYVPLKERIADSLEFLQHLFPLQEGSKLKCRLVESIDR